MDVEDLDRERETTGHPTHPKIYDTNSSWLSHKRAARKNNNPEGLKSSNRKKQSKQRARQKKKRLESNQHEITDEKEGALLLPMLDLSPQQIVIGEYRFILVNKLFEDHLISQRHLDWKKGDFDGWTQLDRSTVVVDITEPKSPILVCLFTPNDPLILDPGKKAATLAQMADFYPPLKRDSWTGKNKMKGEMFGHGFRGGYEKNKSLGPYKLLPKIRDQAEICEPFLSDLDQIVRDYWGVMTERMTHQANDILKVAQHFQTPSLAGTPVGNLTITINGSTPIHRDKDAYAGEEEGVKVGTFAFGVWLDHGEGNVHGGQFVFPQYRIYCKMGHGTSLIWSGRDTFHGTARLETEGEIVRIGTSIQLTEQLCERAMSNMKKKHLK